MKRIVYISLLVLGSSLASCTKEDIKPIAATAEAPVWKSSKVDTTPTFDTGSTTDGNGNGITDPNNDEDQNRKRKGK